MKPIVNIDASNLVFAMREMQQRLGLPTIQPIVENEVRAILSKAIQLTKKGSVKKIRESVYGRIPQKKMPGRKVSQPGTGKQKRRIRATDNSGWITTPDGRKWQRSWTIPDDAWSDLMESKKEDFGEKKARIGLAAQTWLQIAQDLQLQVDAQKRVVNAKVGGAIKRHRASGVKEKSDEHDFVIYIAYDNPIGRYAGARSALTKAINGRVGFFRNNVRRGVFDNLSEVAKKYPGLNVTP